MKHKYFLHCQTDTLEVSTQQFGVNLPEVYIYIYIYVCKFTKLGSLIQQVKVYSLELLDLNPSFPSSCVVVQSLSHIQLFATPGAAAHQASLSFTVSQSLLKLVSIESMTM